MPTVASRFGPLQYDESQVLELVGGLVGLPEVSRFVLVESAVTVDGAGLSLLVVDPRLLVRDFRVELSREDCLRLEASPDDGASILPLALTVLAQPPERSTANLRAPILINTDRMRAIQVVPPESPYSVAHPLLAGEWD